MKCLILVMETPFRSNKRSTRTLTDQAICSVKDIVDLSRMHHPNCRMFDWRDQNIFQHQTFLNCTNSHVIECSTYTQQSLAFWQSEFSRFRTERCLEFNILYALCIIRLYLNNGTCDLSYFCHMQSTFQFYQIVWWTFAYDKTEIVRQQRVLHHKPD